MRVGICRGRSASLLLGGLLLGSSQVAQAQPGFAVAFENEQGRFEQGIAQVAMMIGRVLQGC